MLLDSLFLCPLLNLALTKVLNSDYTYPDCNHSMTVKTSKIMILGSNVIVVCKLKL